MNPRWEDYKDEAYCDYIRTLPCLITGNSPVDCHHVYRKGNDYGSIPLTREIHSEYHAIGRHAFEVKYSFNCDQAIVSLLSSYIKNILNKC